MSGVLINVDANTDKAQRDLAQVNESLKAIKGSTSKVTEGLSSMAKGFAAFALTGGAVAYITSISNEFANLSNSIKLVTEDTKELNKIQSKLVDMSVRNRIEISATTKIYSTLSKNLASAAGSSDVLLSATESIQKAVALSGSSAESATAAIIQLGQGLASGTLRGEELNSVMEQTPRLARAIADGMGVTLGQMRALAAEGKVTSSEVFGAILKQTEKLNSEFAKMTPTLAQASNGLSTAVRAVVNEFEVGLGITGRIAATIVKVSSSLSDMLISARGLGAELGYALDSFSHKAAQIGGPVVRLISAVFEHITKAIPRVNFTRTIFGDFMAGLRAIDDLAGNSFTKISHILRFGIYDLITYDSAAESALKKIKRLSPTNWLTGGLNVQTLNDVFDTKMLYRYAEGFGALSKAISANSDSMFVKIGEKYRRYIYSVRDLARYVGLLPDTFLTFRIGDIDAFNYSITELLRGVTGVQLKFTEVNKLTKELFNSSTMRLQLALEDVAMAIPNAIVDIAKEIFEAILILMPRVKQAITDFFGGPIFSLPELKISIPKIKIFDKMKMPDFVKGNSIVAFVDDSIDAFKELKDKTSDTFIRIKDVIVDAYTAARDRLKQLFSAVHDSIKDFMKMETTLEKLAGGFTEWANWIGYLIGPWAAYLAIILNIAAYQDLVFNASIARRFRDAVVDALQYLKAFAPTIAEAAAEFLGLNDEFRKTTAYAAAWLVVGNAMDAMATFVTHGIHEMVKQLAILNRVSMPQQLYNNIMDSWGDKIEQFTDKLKAVYERIKKFGKDVIRVFFEIWDEVVGHSWWPDTIDGVVNYSQNLTDRVMPAMERFQAYINSIFKDLSKTTLDFDYKEFAINVKLNFVAIKDSIRDVLAQVTNEFPTLMRGLAFGFASLLAYMLLPMNKAVAILLADLALTAVSQLSIFAETLGERVFGQSMAENLGETLGTTVAAYIVEIFKALPGVVNLVVTAAYGFGKAFITGMLGELPFGIGKITSGIADGLFRIVDVVGIGGPLGILSLFLFGRSSISFFKSIGFFKKTIEAIETFFGGFAKYFQGPQQGIIGRFLFGIGPAPVIASMMALLTLAGGFDSLFGGSVLAKYGALGLMGYTMFGGNPVKFVSTVWSRVVVPLFSGLTSYLGSSQTLAGNLLSTIFNSRKAMFGLLAAALYFKSASANAAQISNDAMIDASSGMDRVKDSIIQMKDALIEAAVANPSAAIYGALMTGIGTVLTAKFFHQILVLKRTAAQAASDIIKTTRLDKAFSFGSAALSFIGGLLPTFNGGFKRMIDALKGHWSALAAWMAFQWRDAVWIMKSVWEYMLKHSFAAPFFAVIDDLFKAFSAFTARVNMMFTQMTMRAKKFTTGLTIGVLAGGASMFADGDWSDIVNSALLAVSAFSALGTISKTAQLAVVSFFGKIGSFLLSIVSFSFVLTGIIATFAGGFLAVLFFGEGDTFGDKLDDVWHKLKRMLGISNEIRKNTAENKKREALITTDDRALVKRYGLNDAPSVAGVNFDILNDREKAALDGTLEKYKKALNDAADEYAATGTVSDELKDSINRLGKNTQDIADRLAVKSSRNLKESFINLEKDSQSQDTGWWPSLKTNISQIGLDIGYATVEATRKLRRVISDQETKALITRDLNKQAAEKDTTWKAGWADLGAPDKELQKRLLKIARPDTIGQPALGKAFNESFQDYRQKLFDMRDKVNSNGGFTEEAIANAKDALAYARAELAVLVDQVKAYEDREDAVIAFNNRTKLVVSTLKAINVDIDENQLLAADNASFPGIEQLTSGLKAIDDMLNKLSNKAEGVGSFEERVALMRRKMELQTQLLLDAQHQYDRTISSPQAALSRLSEATGLGFSKEETAKISSGVDGIAETLRFELQGLESLKTQFEKDTSIANIVFPPGTDAAVIERIKKSTSKRELLGLIKDLEITLKDKMLHSLTIGDYLTKLAQSTGVAISGQDVANDTIATSRMRRDALDAIDAKQREVARIRNRVETAPSNSVDDANAIMQAEIDLAKTQQMWSEKVALATPVIESYNEQLNRMGQVASLTTEVLNTMPKQIDIKGNFGMLENVAFKGNPTDMLKALDTKIQYNQRLLGSRLTSPVETVRLRQENEQLTNIYEALGDAIRKSVGSLPSIFARIAAAGANINASDWFTISPELTKELEDLADELINLPKLIAKAKDPAQIARYSKELSQAELDFENAREKVKTGSILAKFDQSNSAARFNLSASATGVSFDRATYGANKAAIDELTRESLNLADWFAQLPESSKDGMMGFMDTAMQSIKIAAENIAFNGPDSSKNTANRLTAAGVNIDAAAANRLSSAQKTAFSAAATAIRDAQIAANNPQLDDAARVKAQETVDNMQYVLSEQIRMATLRPEERPIFQAATNFTNTITDSFINGLKDTLSGKSTPAAFIKSFIDTFTSTVVSTFIEGLMSPLTGENGPIKKMLKDLGTGIFGIAASISDPNTQFGGYVDKFGMWVAALPGANLLNTNAGQPGAIGSFSGLKNFFTTGRWNGNDTRNPDTAGVTVGESIATPSVEYKPLADLTDVSTTGFGDVAATINNTSLDLNRTFTESFMGWGDKMMSGFQFVGASIASLGGGGGGGGMDWFGLALQGLSIGLGAFNSFSTSTGVDVGNGVGNANLKLNGAGIKLGYAEGGQIFGPGTGTSDSLIARLSNGEFIVNAAATKVWLPLLESINSGKMPAFAKGGMVNGVAGGDLILADVAQRDKQSAMNQKTVQEFNIAITGDISRQTRAEIQAMIPNIARGVNSHNAEKGNRQR